HSSELSPSPYVTVLARGWSQEEPETDSSNEDEGPVAPPALPGAGEPMEEGLEKPPAASQQSSGNIPTPGNILAPCRPPPPPPRPPQSIKKQKTPRAATIRVSRKKKKGPPSEKRTSEVKMSSWLDLWKGFRHSVVWASLDGPLMSLWKRRTDKASEAVFHVSSVTKVKRQEKGRFSVYFGKKHLDFMAHSSVVQEGWISALQSSRGQPSPSPPQHHGPITIKDPRNRVYASVFSRVLWVYHNKEDYQVGLAWFSVPLNVANVKPAGKRSFSLITPYKTFSFAVDSTADLSIWQSCLSASIRSAMSCSQVAQRLWENPVNKVCGDCGDANPEWASVNLLLLLCEACAGQHRALGTSLSKVRSLTLDSKVWSEQLIQLFVSYGNRIAMQTWSPAVPADEQLLPAASVEERLEFIRNKYAKGRYRKPHPLASSPALLHQRLCETVCGEDIEETMSLLCSGAKLTCPSEPQSQSPLSLAERAGQTLQVMLLQLNEYTDIPPFLPQSTNDSSLPGEEEALHGKLEDDRFLFSLENDSAACDVLDLREVRSILRRSSLEFEIVTLSDRLICASDNPLELDTHLLHILQVIFPVGVSEAELGGVLAGSKVCLLDGAGCTEGWAILNAVGVSIYPSLVQDDQRLSIRIPLDSKTNYELNAAEKSINLQTGKRNVHLRFEDDYSGEAWLVHLKDVLANQETAPQRPVANQNKSLYHKLKLGGKVPPAVERCISHITQHGLQVDGIYRRCGLAPKVSRLVEALQSRPDSAPMEDNEQGILDVGSALKKYVRLQPPLIPPKQRELWVKAAAQPEEPARLASYRRLLRQLPSDNKATLGALVGHFYMIQMFSSQNQMTAQNLALVLVPTLFQDHHGDLVRLTRDLIIHHALLFLSPEEEEEEEQITAL
ncbi:arf-GAP with Rho-GAP domain, ANK repeat and PH domain-containing protein 1, partial [Gadus chalcogrammus]|uniref:arf-GAP with Rho-GAP domain, ANK repeat and PH domain-containing protein 1 n=1 Tax=Gadus chalcogrammus TaxID=1042646 RepID=UPI0024C4B9D6